VITLIGAIAMGLGTAVSSVISRAIGEGDHNKVRRLTTDSLVLSVLIVTLFVVCGLFTIKPVFALLGADSEMMPLIRQYMIIWYVGAVFVVVPMIGNNAIRATGDAKYPAMIMMVSAAINIAIDPILIFGLFGFPRLGLAGAALATVIARAFSFLISFFILTFREKMIDASFPKIKEVIESWKKVLYIGVPSVLTNLLFPMSVAVITYLVSGFGNRAVAALAAGLRVGYFALIPLMALGAALVPFVGQNWGAKKFKRVCLAINISNYFSFWWGVLNSIVFLSCAGVVAALFSKDAQVVSSISGYLYVVPLSYGFYGMCRLSSAVFNAINYPMRAALISIVRVFVFYIPFAYCGAKLFGLFGIFAGITIANICAGVVALCWVNVRVLKCNG
ncbi:MAG: MATE family efflux transporter, partial [Candidatus Omnitrophica bacterium]|nr:MATE family efflux transporter [Candidatus Omnitrophota bacterium]